VPLGRVAYQRATSSSGGAFAASATTAILFAGFPAPTMAIGVVSASIAVAAGSASIVASVGSSISGASSSSGCACLSVTVAWASSAIVGRRRSVVGGCGIGLCGSPSGGVVRSSCSALRGGSRVAAIMVPARIIAVAGAGVYAAAWTLA